MTQQIKTVRKYITRFKKMAFGGEPDGELLGQVSHYNESGKLISEIKYDPETGLPEKNEYSHDDQGRLIKHVMILEHDGISETFEYNRDEKGRVVNELKLYGDDPGEQTVYEYLAHEHPVKIEKFDADGDAESVETVTYNEKDLPVELLHYNNEGNLEERTVFTYNEADKPVGRTTYDAEDAVLKTMTLRYNDKGELVRVTEKNAEGVVISDVITAYDAKGNVIERKVRDFHSRTLQFHYDDNNNCIEEVMLDENGNLIMKNTFEFDDENKLISESGYYMDMNRSQEGANTMARYEYEWHEEKVSG
ncbi:MAG TPA: hypothetical protein VFW78_01190 [Bacteroidia bacterium]|nr:hypothetical protein [Bacteroidia bacterium]